MDDKGPHLIRDFLPESDFMTESSSGTGGFLKKERECAKYKFALVQVVFHILYDSQHLADILISMLYLFFKRGL